MKKTVMLLMSIVAQVAAAAISTTGDVSLVNEWPTNNMLMVPRGATNGINPRIAGISLAAGGLMTAPVETLVVVTNVATNAVVEHTWYRPTGCPGRLPGSIGSCAVLHCEPVPEYSKTEQDVVTEVVEVKTLTFDWEGQPRRLEHRKVLSQSTVKLKKEETWVPQ